MGFLDGLRAFEHQMKQDFDRSFGTDWTTYHPGKPHNPFVQYDPGKDVNGVDWSFKNLNYMGPRGYPPPQMMMAPQPVMHQPTFHQPHPMVHQPSMHQQVVQAPMVMAAPNAAQTFRQHAPMSMGVPPARMSHHAPTGMSGQHC